VIDAIKEEEKASRCEPGGFLLSSRQLVVFPFAIPPGRNKGVNTSPHALISIAEKGTGAPFRTI
jgi:hypothetical protein